jgi:hypothetical protein
VVALRTWLALLVLAQQLLPLVKVLLGTRRGSEICEINLKLDCWKFHLMQLFLGRMCLVWVMFVVLQCLDFQQKHKLFNWI